MKYLWIALIVLLVGLMAGCKPRRDEPVCHIQPDPEFGYPVCRYY